MMRARDLPGQLACSRLGLFASSLLYASALLYCLAEYASQEWWEYGYSFGGISVVDGLTILIGLGLWSLLAPRWISSPSSTILILIYLAVCIPGLVIPLGLERASGWAFSLLALTLIVSYSTCCIIVRGLAPGSAEETHDPARGFLAVMLALWVVVLVWLVIEYRSIMTLVSLEAIYEQRAAGAATSRWMGYAQTYFGYVLSPALLAYGLVRGNWLLVILGFAGGIVLYSITAEKNAFAFPFLLCGLNFLLLRRATFYRSTLLLATVLATLLLLAVRFSEANLVAAFLAWYVGVRSLLTPGLFIAQYHDFFLVRGHTYLSHVTGFGSIVPQPPGLADERWPSLGHIVGEQYIGKIDLNANANFVATDGLAAFGTPGIAFAFALLALFLIALDRASLGAHGRFAILITVPIGLTLTNVSLFTVALSFGGLFWLVVLPIVWRPQGARG